MHKGCASEQPLPHSVRGWWGARCSGDTGKAQNSKTNPSKSICLLPRPGLHLAVRIRMESLYLVGLQDTTGVCHCWGSGMAGQAEVCPRLGLCSSTSSSEVSQNPRKVWVGRDLKAHPVPPLPWAGTPPTVPGCSQPCPTWPGTLPGLCWSVVQHQGGMSPTDGQVQTPRHSLLAHLGCIPPQGCFSCIQGCPGSLTMDCAEG